MGVVCFLFMTVTPAPSIEPGTKQVLKKYLLNAPISKHHTTPEKINAELKNKAQDGGHGSRNPLRNV